MFRLTTLGGVDLRRPDGRTVRAVVGRPKQTALLVYLVGAAEGTFRRRDTLLSVFWPDLDERRARDALNTALYRLRRALGDDVVQSRGSEEVGVALDRLWYDLAVFERECVAGRPAEALELYRGEFLDGFFLADAPGFERWVDAERQRARARAVEAAWTMAEREEAAGAVVAATQWAGRACGLEPMNERSLRRMLTLLERVGDRAAAVRVYDEFAQSLRRDYDAEPSAETQALAERLRQERRHTAGGVAGGDAAADTDSAWVPGATAAAGAEATGVASAERAPTAAAARSAERPAPTGRPGPAASPGSAERPGIPRRGDGRGERERRRLWRGLAAVAALAIVLGGVFTLVRSAGSAASDGGAPPGIAVLPFSFRGDPERIDLAEGVADLLAASLRGIEGYRVIDPRAVHGVATRGPGTADRPDEHARALNARYYVTGSVVDIGARYRIRAALHRGGRSAEPLWQITAEGTREELARVVDTLAVEISIALAGESASVPLPLSAVATTSMEALEHYLAGQHAFRRGRYAEAMAAFRRAVREDSTFALAHYRLSTAAHWGGSGAAPARRAAEAALRFADRLPAADRLLFQAWHAYLVGNAAEAERLYRALLAGNPSHVEAWFQLGEVIFHWGPVLGRPTAASREAFERVLAFEPDNVGALMHLARLAVLERRRDEFERLAERIRLLEPDGTRLLEVQVLGAFGFDRENDRAGIRMRLDYENDVVAEAMLVSAATFAWAPRDALGLIAYETRPGPGPGTELRARAALLATQIEAAHGRFAIQPRWTEVLAATAPARILEYEVVLATLPFRTVPRDRLDSLRARLLAPNSEEPTGPDANFVRSSAIYPPRRLYLLGLLDIRRGELERARDRADALEDFVVTVPAAVEPTAIDSAMARGFARLLRAELVRAADRPAEALAILGEPGVEPDSTLPDLLSYPKAHERWLRAELLRETGDYAAALRWYRTFPDPLAYDLVYLAPASFRRADILDRLGRDEAAAEARRRAEALWSDAGPVARRWVERR